MGSNYKFTFLWCDREKIKIDIICTIVQMRPYATYLPTDRYYGIENRKTYLTIIAIQFTTTTVSQHHIPSFLWIWKHELLLQETKGRVSTNYQQQHNNQKKCDSCLVIYHQHTLLSNTTFTCRSLQEVHNKLWSLTHRSTQQIMIAHTAKVLLVVSYHLVDRDKNTNSTVEQTGTQ